MPTPSPLPAPRVAVLPSDSENGYAQIRIHFCMGKEHLGNAALTHVNTPESKLTVLLVEDNLGDARLLRHFLTEGAAESFELEHVELLSTALDRLGRGCVALILLDLSLPDSM